MLKIDVALENKVSILCLHHDHGTERTVGYIPVPAPVVM